MNHVPAQNSPCKSASSNVSPRMIESARYFKKGQDDSLSIIPVRSRALQSTRKTEKVICETEDYTPLGGDGTLAPAAEVHEECSWPLDRRRLTNKISLLYNAKSLVRENEIAQEKASEQGFALTPITKARRDVGHGQRIVGSEPTKVLEKRDTKVAAMRRLFDGSFTSKYPYSKEPFHTPGPISSEVSPFYQGQLTALDTPVVTAPTPSPMPPSDYGVYTLPIPKFIHNLPTSIQSTLDVPETHASQPGSPTKKLLPLKSKVIGERVKVFEKALDSTDHIVHVRKRSIFRRKLRKSLRSLFEPSSRRSQEEFGIEKVNLPIGKHEGQHQDHFSDDKVNIAGSWDRVPTGPLSSGGDGTMSEKHSSSVEEEIVEMVVKGVECGLNQPRPVRAVEMKRMALLCRGRVGGILDREKGRAV